MSKPLSHIPRHIPKDSSANEYWKLVRQHGKSRKAMVNFITGIGGYSDRGGRWAIEFCIKDYHSDCSVENLWKLLCSDKMDVGPDPKLPPEHLAQAKALFWRIYEEHKDNVYEWGREEAYESWAESDSPFETFGGTRVDWTWDVRGRQGGHLCMKECAGQNLKVRTEELEEMLNEREEAFPPTFVVSTEDVRALFIICVQNTVDLASVKISNEIEYHAAWRLWVSFCEDELKDVITQYEHRNQLQESAGAIYTMLRSSTEDTGELCLSADFTLICQLADIKIGE